MFVSTTHVTDVVSSLVQLMCDSHYRTITGLESLVQKEWIAMEHPFTSRSGLVTEDSTENDEGKVSYYTLSHVVVKIQILVTSILVEYVSRIIHNII